jgi:RNA recognition motif. (a.k.a. RRM, RBD, or RNP domain)
MLKSYFQTFGKVIEANIVYNHETMKSRGFGFVIFQDEKTVQEVLKRYDDHYLFGKWIECKPALLKEEVTPNETPQQTPHNTMQNHRGGYHGQPMGHHQGQNHGHGMPQPYGAHHMHHQMRGGMQGHGPAGGNQRGDHMVGNMAHMPVPNVHRGRGGNPAPMNHRGGAQAMPRPQTDDSGSQDQINSGVDSSDGPKRGGYSAQAPKRGGGPSKVDPAQPHMHHNPQTKPNVPEDDDKEDSEGQDDTQQSGIQTSSGPSNSYYDYSSQYSHGGHQAGYSYTAQNAGYNYGLPGHPHHGTQSYGMYNYGPGGISRQPPKPSYPSYGGNTYDYNTRTGYGQHNPMHMKTTNSHMAHNQYYEEPEYGEEAQVPTGARPPLDAAGYANMKGDYNRNDRTQKGPNQGMQYAQQYGAHLNQPMYGSAGPANTEQSGSYDYTSTYKQTGGKPGPEMGGPAGMGYNYRQPQMQMPPYNAGVNESESGKPHGGPSAAKMPGGGKPAPANPNKK